MRWLLVLLFAAQTQPSSIEGTVVAGSTNRPVPAARILVTSLDGNPERAFASAADAAGRFTVRGLPSGEYRVFAFHDDFTKTVSSVVQVGPGRPVPDLTLRLTPTGVIAGRVFDEFNEPIAGAFVRAVSRERTFETRTDDRGEYRLHGLPAGAYIVSAAPYAPPRIDPGKAPFAYIVPTPPSPFARGEGQGMMNLTGLLKSGEFIHPMALRGETYARVYHPGTVDESKAAPVQLAPGAVVNGINLPTAVAQAR